MAIGSFARWITIVFMIELRAGIIACSSSQWMVRGWSHNRRDRVQLFADHKLDCDRGEQQLNVYLLRFKVACFPSVV